MSSYSTTDDASNRELALTDIASNRNKAEKLRVAIGLFDQATSLSPALQELLSQGFTTAQLCVSGSQDTVTMVGSVVQNQNNIDPTLVDLFVHTEAYDTPTDCQTVVGSRGKLFKQLNSIIGQSHNTALTLACDECPKLTAELRKHVEQDRLVLVVDTSAPRQLIHASRVILRYSSHDIETHEFRLAAER